MYLLTSTWFHNFGRLILFKRCVLHKLGGVLKCELKISSIVPRNPEHKLDADPISESIKLNFNLGQVG